MSLNKETKPNQTINIYSFILLGQYIYIYTYIERERESNQLR